MAGGTTFNSEQSMMFRAGRVNKTGRIHRHAAESVRTEFENRLVTVHEFKILKIVKKISNTIKKTRIKFRHFGEDFFPNLHHLDG
jgi:hypothetical protein